MSESCSQANSAQEEPLPRKYALGMLVAPPPPVIVEVASAGPAWLQLLLAAVAGGLVVKLLDLFYAEVRRRSEVASSIEEFAQKHADPLLKAADELLGKLYSLAEEDFRSIPPTLDSKIESDADITLSNIAYLFCQMWASIEMLRRESLYVRLAASTSGRQLTEFIRCLESRRVRLVDRARQRALGETLLGYKDNKSGVMGFRHFTEQLEETKLRETWLAPLLMTLMASNTGAPRGRRQARQRLLRYAVVLHALTDTLDTEHTTTRDRPSQPNKLTVETRRDLTFRIFRLYLPFVSETSKYTIPRSGAKSKVAPAE